jgi:hypothetical protein
MREAYLVRRVIAALNLVEGCYAMKVHQTRYSRSGEPDIVGSFMGQSFAIEVKRPGGRPTDLQLYRLNQWAKAGARAGVATSVADAKEIACGVDPA